MRLYDGRELNLVFPFDFISVRVGSVITLLTAFRAGMEVGYYTRIINPATLVIFKTLTNTQGRALVNIHFTAKEDTQKPVLPESGSILGFYQKTVHAVQALKKNMAQG